VNTAEILLDMASMCGVLGAARQAAWLEWSALRSRPCLRSGVCAVCGAPIAAAWTGRPRNTCSDACRQRAYRRRKGNHDG